MATNQIDASISKKYAYTVSTITNKGYDATITKVYSYTSSVTNSNSVVNPLSSKTY